MRRGPTRRRATAAVARLLREEKKKREDKKNREEKKKRKEKRKRNEKKRKSKNGADPPHFQSATTHVIIFLLYL
jgi:hypothetical protein